MTEELEKIYQDAHDAFLHQYFTSDERHNTATAWELAKDAHRAALTQLAQHLQACPHSMHGVPMCRFMFEACERGDVTVKGWEHLRAV